MGDDDWRVPFALLRRDVDEMKRRQGDFRAFWLTVVGGVLSLTLATVIGGVLLYWLTRRG